LEGLVEGTFSRVFRSSVRPVELGRRMVRMLDAERSVDVAGRTIVPNAVTVHLSDADYGLFAGARDGLERELAEEARSVARSRDWAFMGPLSVRLVVDERLRIGRSKVTGEFATGAGGTGAGSLVLPDGRRLTMGVRVVSIGRLRECDVSLDDPKVSRHHAEVHPDGDGYVLVDLGSTNGTTVNGFSVDRHRLADGDLIGAGGHTLRFEAS
jgi:hypothetical protein